MSRSSLLRLVLSSLAVAVFLGSNAIAQSQDSQSVAEAARRAREEKKKAAEKPARVITEDDVKPATPDGSGAAPAPAGAPATSDASNAQAAGTAGAPGPKDEKKSTEIGAVKEQIKQTQGDLDLLQRDQALQQDTYYSNPDFAHDTAGKAKLDGMKQQVSDKQQELDKLKAHLAELGGTMDNPAATPPKS